MARFNIFSRKETYKASEYLLNHQLKDKCFYRLLQFQILKDNMVFAWDIKNNRTITFDPWPQLIFLNATGSKTIYQFVIEQAHTYKSRVPDRLAETIFDEIETLVEEGAIAISDEKVNLPPNLLYPIKSSL